MNHPDIRTMIDVLTDRAARSPEKVAFVNLRDGKIEEKNLSYAELDDVCRRSAAALQKRVAAGERLLLLLPQGVEFVVGFCSVLYSGAIAVPAHTPKGNKRSWATFEAIISDCNPRAIVTCRSIQDKLIGWARSSEMVARLDVICLEELQAECSASDWRPLTGHGTNVAFLQYTSGSTSAPKGVMVSHENLLHNADFTAKHMRHSEDTVIVSWLPLFHDLGLIGIVCQTLFVGATCYMMSPAVFSANPVLWLQAISQYRASSSMSSDFGYRLCVKLIRPEQLSGLDLSCWRNALNAAEPIHAGTIREFSKKFESVGFSSNAFFPAYGLAEATLLTTTSREGEGPVILGVDKKLLADGVVKQAQTGASYETIDLVSSGRPSDDMEVAIVDPATLKRCVAGTLGEVWVKGPSVALGYWGDPEDATKTFRQTPEGESTPEYLRTGDLGFVWKNELFVAGRLKDLMIQRGRNIYPQDIELTVKECSPAFRAVNGAAFSVEADDGEAIVVVQEVERTKRSAFDLRELEKVVRNAVWEEHEVRVADVVFISPASLPKTSSGKVQRRLTKELYSSDRLSRLQPPRLTSTESMVALKSGHESDEVKPHLNPERERRDRLTADHIAWIRQYGRSRINSKIIDERRCVPPYIIMDMANRKLFGTLVPSSFGGQDLGYRSTLKIIEQLSAVDLTLAHILLVHNFLGTLPILAGGTRETQETVLPRLTSGQSLAAFALTEPGAGSNPQAIEATARPVSSDRWSLSGTKWYSGNASWAGYISVFVTEQNARGDRIGISGFLLNQGTKGLNIGPEAMTMGMRGMVQSSFSMSDLNVSEGDRLGKPGHGMELAQKAMTATRLPIAAAAIGAMKKCVQLMHRYAERRNIATGRLIDHPTVILSCRTIVFQIALLEAMIYRIAELVDAGNVPPIEIYHVAKIMAPECAWGAVDQLVQMLGARGYTENNPASQLMRDVRVLRIFEGPSEALESHLGAKVLSEPEEIYQFLRVVLGQAQLADRLRSAIDAFRTRVHSGAGPFEDQLRKLRWMQSRVARLACHVIMHAFLLEGGCEAQKDGYERVVQWSSILIAAEEDDLLKNKPIEAVPLASGEIDGALRSYLFDIGDVEQSLPGEEWASDPLLKSAFVQEADSFGVGSGNVERVVKATRDRSSNIQHDEVRENSGGATETDPTALAVSMQLKILSRVSELVGIPVKTLGPDDSFGTMGIDSVFAAQLASGLNGEFALSLDPTIFWHYPTPAKLVAFLTSGNIDRPRKKDSEKAKSRAALIDMLKKTLDRDCATEGSS